MNEAKISRIESGLNGMAKKVLDAVPAQSPWSKDQIAIEIRRRGSGADRAVLDGCLDSLRGRGLIKEPTRGQFIRVVRKTTTTQPEEDTTMAVLPTRPPAPAEPDKNDILTRMSDLSASLRVTADQVDAIALDVEERIQAIEKDTDKLRQLQALLKSIGQQ